MGELFQQTLDKEVIDYDNKLDSSVALELKKSKLRLSIAESLSGGLVAHRLNQLPGSWLFFNAGIICYNTLGKIQFCGVSPKTIQKQGEISRDVAIEMAVGLKQKTKADVSISNLGIAGPANDDYAIGVVGKAFIACVFHDDVKVKHYQFYGSRSEIQLKCSQATLMLLKQWIISQKGFKN